MWKERNYDPETQIQTVTLTSESMSAPDLATFIKWHCSGYGTVVEIHNSNHVLTIQWDREGVGLSNRLMEQDQEWIESWQKIMDGLKAE